ncbi:MAG: trypsin-like peptidase domain-containing protein, partial [Caldilineaceae bacterium]
MAWSPFLTNLQDLLADLFFTQEDTIALVRRAGLSPAKIPLSGSLWNWWGAILAYAEPRPGAIDALVREALAQNPENAWLQNAARGDLNGMRGPDMANDLAWQAPPDAANLEKIIGDRSTLLPIAFLEIGVERARAVARIVTAAGNGTGFLISDGAGGALLITNHHVLPDAATAAASPVQFNVQQTRDGLDTPPDVYAQDPAAGFATSKEDDWSAVRMVGDPAARWGLLPCNPDPVAKETFLNIIQHPGGGPKQIAIYRNTVVYADARVVQYLTDTLPGSSGSPCFNDRWEVVALHHSGGWLREPGAKGT